MPAGRASRGARRRGASTYRQLVPLGPRRRRTAAMLVNQISGPPSRYRGPPAVARSPQPRYARGEPTQGAGQFNQTAVVVKWGRTGFRLTTCASAAAALAPGGADGPRNLASAAPPGEA